MYLIKVGYQYYGGIIIDYSFNEFNKQLNWKGYMLNNLIDEETAIDIIVDQELTMDEFIDVYKCYLEPIL